MNDLMKNKIVDKIANQFGLNVIYSEVCGSQKYRISTARDLDLLIIAEDKPNDLICPYYDEESQMHVFIRSRRNVEDLLNFKITPKNFDFPFYAGLTQECCSIFDFDFFRHFRELKDAARMCLKKSCCSGNLIKYENGIPEPTRQSKGLYHALALMYKLKNKSFEITDEQLQRMTEAHDKKLPDSVIDEIYKFYDL